MIVALRLMRDDELHRPRLVPRPRSVGAVVENLREGLRFVRHTPIVLLAVTTVGLVATFGMNFQVVIPPLAQDVLGSDASGYGFLMTASGLGALVGGRRRSSSAGEPRPIRIALGAIVLGVASIALAAVDVVPAVAAADGPDRCRRHRDGRDRQRHDPAGGPGRAARSGDERLHDGLLGVDADRRPADGRARLDASASSQAIAIGGVLSLAVRASARSSGIGGSAPAAGGRDARGRDGRREAALQSTAPNTNAAFSPPNPNEVLSTRR